MMWFRLLKDGGHGGPRVFSARQQSWQSLSASPLRRSHTSSLPIVDKFLRWVVVLTVFSAKLYAEDKLKIQQKSTENSLEYLILTRVTVSWMHPIK